MIFKFNVVISKRIIWITKEMKSKNFTNNFSFNIIKIFFKKYLNDYTVNEITDKRNQLEITRALIINKKIKTIEIS